MKKNKGVVDVTLRDGEQCAGLAFTQEEKIRLALLIDEIGVHEMEVGIGCKNTFDAGFFEKIMKERKKSKVSLWCRMNLEDIGETLAMQPDIIHIGVPVSYVQIYTKLRKNKLWVQKQIELCLEETSKFGIPVTIGMEDATRADIGFMCSVIRQIMEFGVETIRIADTVGVITPDRGVELVKLLKKTYPKLSIELHEHNDLGMAVANSVTMANAGADLIDCTLLGIGERAGNCNMKDFLQATEHIFDCNINKPAFENAQMELSTILGHKLHYIC